MMIFHLNVIEFTTLGRKHQLSLIREKMNKKQEEYFRIFSDNQLNNMTNFDLIEETKRIDEYDKFTSSNNELKSKLKLHRRRRFLQFWQDGSTIFNHGHILIMVNAVYDKALYTTDDEYYLKLGCHKNVQVEVEKTELYLIARFTSNDQQMLYTDTRNKDHQMTRYPTKISGEIYLHDIIRFFHGDGPACQLEAGQQKGGDSPCWTCSVDINQSYDVPYVYYQPIMGNRGNKGLHTNSSKVKAKLKHVHMFSNLKKHEIEIELEGRNVEFSEEENTPELKQKLTNEIHGIQRLPTLFLKLPLKSFCSIPMKYYHANRYMM